MPDLPISQAQHDIVTPLIATILRNAGESAYRRLVVPQAPAPAAAHRSLDGVRPDQLLSRPVKHPQDALAGLAGLWLWHDALDECHRIVQDIASPTGSFWHAIMHRREGDFSNSKYWYRRCPNHHVMKLMGSVAASGAGQHARDPAVTRALSGGWDPAGFVDLVEAVHADPADQRHEVAVRLQRIEWQGLFEYCLHEAIDADRSGLDAWDKRVTQSSGD